MAKRNGELITREYIKKLTKKPASAIDKTSGKNIFETMQISIGVATDTFKKYLRTLIIGRDTFAAQSSLEADGYEIIQKYENKGLLIASIKNVTYPREKHFIVYNVKTGDIIPCENGMEAKRFVSDLSEQTQ